MNINITACTEDKEAIEDYAKSIFSQKTFIILNKRIVSNPIQSYTLTQAISKIHHSEMRFDLRSKDNTIGLFIHSLSLILNDPQISLEPLNCPNEQDALKAFNLFMQKKGYLGFLSQNEPTNIPEMPDGTCIAGGFVNFQESTSRWAEILFDFPERRLRYHGQQSQVLTFRTLFQNSTMTKEALLTKYKSLMSSVKNFEMQNFFYQKMEDFALDKNGVKVVSSWGKDFLQQFDLNKVHSLPLTSINNISIYSDSGLGQYSSSRSYNQTANLLREYASFNSKIKMGPLASLTLVDDTNSYGVVDNFQTQVKELILNSTQSRIQGFSLASYKKACLDKPFYEVIEKYTKKQALKRNGFFIPFLVPVKILSQNMSLQTVFFYTFVFFDERQKLFKKSISKETLTNFSKKYALEKGLYFYDFKSYLIKIKESFGSQALLYSESFLEILKDLSPEQVKLLKTKTSKELKTYTTFNSLTNAAITAKPKVDLKLVSKYNKFKTRFSDLESKKTKSLETVKSLASRIDIDHNQVLRLKSQIEDYQKSIKLIQSVISVKSKELKEETFLLENLSATYFNNIESFKKLENEYDTAISEALTSNNFSTSSFFNALAEDNIKLLNITYRNTSGNSEINYDLKHLFDTSENFLKIASEIIQNEDNKIETVEFLIDRPAKIIVDSKPNKFVFGGPYVVKVSPGNLNIKLAYPNSLFGYEAGNSSYLIHPHCSRKNFETIISCDNYARACLGEAQPLLYSAFKKNDLKLIVLSAMTWVNSANSTDTWGRHYKYFPKSITFNPVIKDEEDSEITPSEVQEFIENITDEDSEDTDDPPLVDTAADTLFDTLVNNIEAHESSNSTVVPVTDEPFSETETTQAYVRYTPI